MFFDTHGRPLPRFYSLTIERRAELIAHERTSIVLQRRCVSPRTLAQHYARALSLGSDSVYALDALDTRASNAMYRRILTGEV